MYRLNTPRFGLAPRTEAGTVASFLARISASAVGAVEPSRRCGNSLPGDAAILVAVRCSLDVPLSRVHLFRQDPWRGARRSYRTDVFGGTRRITGVFDPPAAERTVQVD